MDQTAAVKKRGKRKLSVLLKRYWPFYLMMAPGLIYLIINNYLPMFGLVIAFKKIDYRLGIWKSPWVGLSNFTYLFKTSDAWIITRNTICYNAVFIVLGTVISIGVAILLNEIRGVRKKKAYQTLFLIPYLISTVVISYLVFTFLSSESGFINNSILQNMGKSPINWYGEKKYWPFILVIVFLWKSFGYNCIIYYASILGIDYSLYEAAVMDGASRWQRIKNIIMVFLSLCCLLPFVLLVISSVTEETALIRDGYSFFPKAFSLDAYKYIFSGSAKIIRAYGITVFISFAGTAMGILMTILLAYPLSRAELPGRNAFAFFIFFTMLFNGGLVPSYMIWSNTFHIKDTIWALLFPNLLMNAFNIIMMRNYRKANIPDEIIEAARIDGASEFTILFKVIFPMSVPMVATLGLLVGLGYWNDWQNGLYYIASRTELYSVQNILNRMLQDAQFIASGQAGGQASEIARSLPSVGIKMAIAVAGILPVLLIYPFVQRYLVKGITIGAVKG